MQTIKTVLNHTMVTYILCSGKILLSRTVCLRMSRVLKEISEPVAGTWQTQEDILHEKNNIQLYSQIFTCQMSLPIYFYISYLIILIKSTSLKIKPDSYRPNSLSQKSKVFLNKSSNYQLVTIIAGYCAMLSGV
jgi:hypothetical protein